jgi:hypothetical protein
LDLKIGSGRIRVAPVAEQSDSTPSDWFNDDNASDKSNADIPAEEGGDGDEVQDSFSVSEIEMLTESLLEFATFVTSVQWP